MATQIQQSIFAEVADFLVSQPGLQDLADYQISPAVQQLIDDLLDKNNTGGLAAEERLQLEKMLAVSQVMTLAKTKASLKLSGKA